MKLSPFRKSKLIVLVGVFIITPLFSNDHAKEGAKKAAQDYAIKEAVKSGVNAIAAKQISTEAARQAAQSAALKPGETLIGVYSLFTATDSFFKAETERQRFYAAGDITAAVLVLTGEPVSSVVVSVVVLVDRLRDMRHRKQIAKIKERTAQILKEVFEIKKNIVEAQILKFSNTFERIDLYSKEKSTYLSLFDNHCTDEESYEDLLLIEACITFASKIVSNHRMFIFALKELFSLSGNYVTLDTILEKAEIDRKLLEQEVVQSESVLPNIESEMNKNIQVYSDYLAQNLVSKVKEKALLEIQPELDFVCDRFAHKILNSLSRLNLQYSLGLTENSNFYLDSNLAVNEANMYISQPICQNYKNQNLQIYNLLINQLSFLNSNVARAQ